MCSLYGIPFAYITELQEVTFLCHRPVISRGIHFQNTTTVLSQTPDIILPSSLVPNNTTALSPLEYKTNSLSQEINSLCAFVNHRRRQESHFQVGHSHLLWVLARREAHPLFCIVDTYTKVQLHLKKWPLTLCLNVASFLIM